MPGPLFADTVSLEESDRLQVLEQFALTDMPGKDFDRFVSLAAHIANAPVASLSVVGRDRTYFKAKYGTPVVATQRAASFSAHALAGEEFLIVLNAATDPRFAAMPSVVDAPRIRFYVGAPLVANSGHVIGALCAVDFAPRRRFPEESCRALRDLAKLIMQQLEIRRLQHVGAEARRKLRQRERQFEVLVGGIKDCALYMLDPDGIVTSWNAGAQNLKRYAANEIIGQHFSRFYTDFDRGEDLPLRALRAAKEKGKFETQAWHVRKDGTLFWADIVVEAIHGEDGGLIGFAKITRDITDRRNNEKQLQHLAHYDVLTGLANRYSFLDKLDTLIKQRSAAILVANLDGFKEINDTLGHQAGDFLLKAAADRLEEAVVGKGGAARLGSDEFGVIIQKSADPIEAARVSDAIVKAFEKPLLWQDRKIDVGVSVGIAISPNHGSSAHELLASADLALYEAKKRHRGGYSLFQESFRQTILARKNCEAELKRAVSNGELELYYQPQVALKGRRVVGAEALLRWNHPHRGLLAPGAFIQVLEQSPLAAPVGNWIIRSACEFAAHVQAHGQNQFRVAANVFGVQFRGGDLLSTVTSALADYQLLPGSLELEITENIVLQNDDFIVGILRRLAQMGVRAAFDDYGTGYASLSLLKRFPLARLKIDVGFVSNLTADPEDTAVIKAIIYLAESFGLDVVAEGIENKEQERILRDLGCQYGQGYFYARPMPIGEFMAMLAMAGETTAGDASPLLLGVENG